MNGGRRYVEDDGECPEPLNPGDYLWWPKAGGWYACTPNGHHANLGRHSVVEHEDGTITVSPSILVSEGYRGVQREVWHGYLERGVWRAC